MKKLRKCILLLVLVLIINQVAFLVKVQFICNQKITEGKDLNLYELVSAYQTHTNFWLFGWIVSPNTAQLCFYKQFFVVDPFWLFPIEEDSCIKKAKHKIKNGADSVRLTWKAYDNSTSLYLNGAYLTTTYVGNTTEGVKTYKYIIPSDYKPGIIKVGPVILCETIFDYLENKHIISNYTYHRLDGDV